MIAMAGMLFSGDKTFISMSIGTMIVVAVAMIGSLTVLPAVLSKLGDRVEKGRIPLLGRFRRPAGESRIWSRILNPVLRRPAISAAISVGGAGSRWRSRRCRSTPRPRACNTLPRSAATVETINRIQAAFPGQATPGRGRGQDRHDVARVQGRGRSAAVGGSRHRPGLRCRSASTATPRTRSRRIAIPLPGNGTTESRPARC